MSSNARTDDPQRVILECIRDFIAEHCYPPTITEICQLVGLRSKGTAAVHLRKLRDFGLLTWVPGQERTFVVTDTAWAALEVVKAWFDSAGGSQRRCSRRRRLMRDLLRRPDVRPAIEDVMTRRGISRGDAFALMSAHIEAVIKPCVYATARL